MLSDEMGGFVPVIDPNQAGFSFLVSLVRMQLRPSRLTYSKVSLAS
jgi:Asp/Glu/hydantoin racemase